MCTTHCTVVTPYTLHCTDVPTLPQLQEFVKGLKSSKTAGIIIQNLNDLLAYSQQFSLPASVPLLTDGTDCPPAALVASVASNTLFIPMDVHAYNIHGACFIGSVCIPYVFICIPISPRGYNAGCMYFVCIWYVFMEFILNTYKKYLRYKVCS